MTRFVIIFTGAALAVVLMVAALAAWFQAPVYASAAERPDVLRWAIRSLAVAAAAGAQVVALSLVVGRVYENGSTYKSLRLAAAVVCCVAAVTAAALGVASQG